MDIFLKICTIFGVFMIVTLIATLVVASIAYLCDNYPGHKNMKERIYKIHNEKEQLQEEVRYWIDKYIEQYDMCTSLRNTVDALEKELSKHRDRRYFEDGK